MARTKEGKDQIRIPDNGLHSLSALEFLILEILMQSTRELYGLEMVEASSDMIKRGTIYITLQRMQEKGLVDSKPEPHISPEIGIPRRLYSVTRFGEHVHRANQPVKALSALQSALC